MSNIYFTSDNHFCHENVIRFCNRPFESVEDMNNGMIRRWNSTVGKDDTVIVVGDFCFGNSAERYNILQHLNGTKILVQGNHDKGKQCPKGFDLMVRELTIDIAGYPVTVKHYPLRWPWYRRIPTKIYRKLRRIPNPRYLDRMPVDRGQYHIHGHTHSKDKYNGNQIHVGVDAWDYRPVAINKIVAYIQSREARLGRK